MKLKNLAIAVAMVAVSLGSVGVAHARDQIQIVGSSTVFPFATKVAEEFGKSTTFKTPVVESTGSGGGMKLFCAGVGLGHPDITNASRRIKAREFSKCTENGISVSEVKIGFDGIALANSRKGPEFILGTQQIFQALAKNVPGADGKLIANPYKKWSDIDKRLPDTRIEVLGPPPTSGTRDAFVELAMEKGAKAYGDLKKLRKTGKSDADKMKAADLARSLGASEACVDTARSRGGKKAFQCIAHAVREDGAFVEAGENDNLIVQKLVANPSALGIFGFSFLDQNADKVKGAVVDGALPSFDNISGGDYPVSRSLFFYVKKEHAGVVPGIKDFVAEFTSERAWGPDGYLADKGLIPLPDADRKAGAASALILAPLSM